MDVSENVDEDIHMLAITQEIDGMRVVMFFRFDDDELSEWVLHLLLHFDLSISTGVDTSDESRTLGFEDLV